MITPSSSWTSFEAIRRAIDSVPETEQFRVEDVLKRFPELQDNHKALVELAYEEYCQAADRGESLDVGEFAARFPEIEASLLKALEVHSLLFKQSVFRTQEAEIHWPEPGDVFLGFRLLELIGKGAFSRVFAAEELDLGRRSVVVKISSRGTAEASLLGVLDHANIVPIHSIHSDDMVKLSALCMPNLGRTTAAEWIRTRFKKPDSRRAHSHGHLQSVIQIGLGVCQGLQFAHDRGILHCDVKPSNLLITHDGEPLLLDFNLSTDRTKEEPLVGGTLNYMAPEQLQRAAGDSQARITEQTDVFCLGATLYEMATGAPPFALAVSEQRSQTKLIRDALVLRKEFAERNHPLPDPLCRVLLEALAYDPRNRIPSARVMFEKLRDCQQPFAPARPRWLWPIAAAALLSLGWLGETPFGSTPPRPPVGRMLIASTPVHRPIGNPLPEALTVGLPVREAHLAEKEGRYKRAIELYRQILRQEELKPTLRPVDLEELRHCLAFCLLMDRQFVEASILLETLAHNDFDQQTPRINRIAGLTLLAFSEKQEINLEKLKQAFFELRPILMESDIETRRDYQHLIAVMYAHLGAGSIALEERTRLFRVQEHAKNALKLGLPESKCLPLGELLTELNFKEPLLSIRLEKPHLIPNRELDVPVRSPYTGKNHSIRITLP